MTLFERHDLVTLAPAWRAHLAAPLGAESLEAIAAWCAAGRPFVVASRGHGDAPQTLRLGLAGPGKTRLGFGVEAGAIATQARPLLLIEWAASLPPAWQGVLSAMERIAARHTITLRLYGSAAMQALTGLAYLTPTSDLDLLIEAEKPGEMEALHALSLLESPVRLDGEIRLAGMGEVAWREWLSGADKVLLKTRQGPRLIHRQEAACFS